MQDEWRSGDKPGDGDVGNWSLPLLLLAAYAIAFVDRALVSVVAAPMKAELGLSGLQFGLLSGTAFALIFCLAGVPLGWLGDRTDPRRMIAGGLVLWSAMTALCGLAQSYGSLFAARVGVGVGEAVLLPAGMAWLRRRMRPQHMGRAVAIFLMGAATGAFLAHFAGGLLLAHLERHAEIELPWLGALAPWRILFLVAAPPGLLLAIVVLGARPAAPGEVSTSTVRETIAVVWARRGAFGPLTAATACTVMMAQAPAAWLPLFYVREFGLSPGQAAVMVGLMFILSVPLGQWTGGFLIDRLARQSVRAPPNTVLALAAALALAPAVLFCLARELWLSQVAYLLFSVLASAATPCGLVGWQALAPARVLALTTALLVSVVTLVGIGIGPALVGLLSDHLFEGADALRSALLTLLVTICVAGSAFALAGRRAFDSVTGLSSACRGATAPGWLRRADETRG